MRQSVMRPPLGLSTAVLALMLLQAASGLALRQHYRDVKWIRDTWLGNDAVTLLLGVPLLAVALQRARRGSARAALLWAGMLGYAIYNYAYYLLGAALNAFLPLYVLLLVSAVFALVRLLRCLEPPPRAPSRIERAVGGWFGFVAFGLSMVWLGLWGAHVFAGADLPIAPEAFKLVAALDLAIMVPALALAGVLLWRRAPWGIVAGATAGVQGSLYLLVLTVNSVLAMLKGTVEGAGELPIWGTLWLATSAATALLFRRSAAPQRSS